MLLKDKDQRGRPLKESYGRREVKMQGNQLSMLEVKTIFRKESKNWKKDLMMHSQEAKTKKSLEFLRLQMEAVGKRLKKIEHLK